MITPMSRIVVAATSASKEQTLNSLCEWGVLHVLPLQTPENEQVTAAKTALSNAQRAFEALPAKAIPGTINETDLLSQISNVMQSKKNAEEALSQGSAELKKLEPFGNFNPSDIKDLLKQGLYVKLYSTEKKYSVPSKDFIVQEFKKVEGETFFAVFSKQPINLPYTEITLPSKPVAEIKKDCDNAAKTIEDCNNKLATYASKRKSVGELVVKASDELAYKAADAGMHSEMGLCFIQGYCPKEKIASLKELSAKNGWGISVQEPSKDEAVPTLLKHSKIVKPIDALYNVIDIGPGYREIDISSVFLCFFSIFFAMIVGDVVYGLLFVVISLWASKKFPNAPRHIFHFMYLMSGCTIVWGILNGSFLGLNKTGDVMMVPAFLDIARASYSPEGLKNFANWIRDDETTKMICFVLGVIHLSIARIWNAAVHFKEKPAFLVQIGWLFITWTMFFLTCQLVLNKPMPEVIFYIGGAGIALILFGNILIKEWFNVGMLPLDLVSGLTNIISYIRLFAVGMAGYAIANAFSTMVAPLFSSIPGTIGALIILLFVHTLNLALCAMGVAVHAIRLNTLEFSNNIGVEWLGDPFIPFRKKFNHPT
jgi:V/A-type H+-transporting ATPase subunit I